MVVVHFCSSFIVLGAWFNSLVQAGTSPSSGTAAWSRSGSPSQRWLDLNISGLCWFWSEKSSLKMQETPKKHMQMRYLDFAYQSLAHTLAKRRPTWKSKTVLRLSLSNAAFCLSLVFIAPALPKLSGKITWKTACWCLKLTTSTYINYDKPALNQKTIEFWGFLSPSDGPWLMDFLRCYVVQGTHLRPRGNKAWHTNKMDSEAFVITMTTIVSW